MAFIAGVSAGAPLGVLYAAKEISILPEVAADLRQYAGGLGLGAFAITSTLLLLAGRFEAQN